MTTDQELHGRKEKRSEEGEKGGKGETPEVWNGVRLVGMRQPELEGHKGVLEEIYTDKVQVLLVGGMRRVQVDKKKVVQEVVEPVEVLPPGFEGWSFLEQLGVGSAPTMDEVKAAYKKWVLRLHSDKVQRSAEHTGATRNAPWHGLGLEARGTETGRQATKEPKGRATPCREKEKEWKSKKPDGKESPTLSTRLSWGEDPPATETHTGEPQPPVIQQHGTTMWSEVRPWMGLRTPLPNGNGAAVSIGCGPATTTRSELSRRRSKGQGQTPGRGKATPALFEPGW